MLLDVKVQDSVELLLIQPPIVCVHSTLTGVSSDFGRIYRGSGQRLRVQIGEAQLTQHKQPQLSRDWWQFALLKSREG